ncbi:RNA-binding KH domain-containing protein [Striga asiatica]|uniref:RNA-binding KH domain-containing protein n=1 Tax=Striga asiatica TaxID=4170 RepID=A0A5A7NY73_STRAF|nr:RNA-binding KH domain-containing protein [Striga asiatica]
MGCCISTASTSPKTPKFPKTAPINSSISKSPPRILEEETVKEVLSEIRTVPKTPPGRAHGAHRHFESPFVRNGPFPPVNASKDPHNGVRKPHPAFVGGGDDLSEDVGSEICSTLGECESVGTNPAEKGEEKGGGQIRQMSPARRRDAPFSSEVKRERPVGRSPVRRSDPSPGRARPGNGSGSGYGRRRDAGESSGRRSKSPVTRIDSGPMKTGSGLSPSARKTGKSPGRTGSGSGQRVRKLDEERTGGGDEKWPPTIAI